MIDKTTRQTSRKGVFAGGDCVTGPATLIEAMAQVSSVLIFGENGEPQGQLAFFMGIDKAKFRRTVTPGDQLVIEAEMIHVRHNACKVRAVAMVDNAVAAEAVMSFGLVENEESLRSV
mgnify:CR=1 FL=1